MFDTKLTNNLPNVNNPMPFSMNNRWGGNYPWMPNFKFPTNPLAQASSPHTTKADAQGIQQAMQKRSEQESPYRSSATGESKNIKFKHDVSGHATGQSAFDSLDGYMKKAGLNSFQSQFFTRLIKAGLDENQIKAHITKAGAEFGEKVAEELNDGFEKLGFAALGNFALKSLAKVAPRLTSFGAKQVARKGLTKGLAHTAGRAIKTTPQAIGQAAKNTFTSPAVRGQMATGALTGVVNPYTGVHTWSDDQGNIDWGKALKSVGGGTLLGRFGRNLGQNAMRRGMVGEGIGYTAGWGANIAGYDVDPMQFARYGFAGGAMTPGRLGNMLPKSTASSWAASSPVARKILRTPLTNMSETGVLNRLDLPGQAVRYAGKGLSHAGSLAKQNPLGAIGAGGALAAGAGAAYTPFAIQNAKAELQKQMDPLIEQGQQTMYNVNQAAQNVSNLAQNPLAALGGGEGGFMGNIGQVMKDNPWLLPALLGGVGLAGGGLLGGKQGATLGGIGLPLIYLLASGQGQQMLGNMFGGQQQDDVAKTQADLEAARGNNQAAENVNQPVAEAPANGSPEVSELERQQQAQLDPEIQGLLNRANPTQLAMFKDPNVSEDVKVNILIELARQNEQAQ